MTLAITPFLRRALLLDAGVSGAAAVLLLAGGPLLSPLLGLPQALLVWAGIAMVPFVVLLVVVARRSASSRMTLVDIVALNALWVAASLGLLVSGLVAPTALGYVFVLAQAAAVALFATLQFLGLRRAGMAAA